MRTKVAFTDTVKSYGLVVGLGVAAGIVTELLNMLPADTLWSFSSIASAFGFWMITTTLVIYLSCSNKNAAINVFLYLSSMNFCFYFFQGLLGCFFERYFVEGFMSWGLLLRFDLFALVCAVIAYGLYYWNKPWKISSVLYALPICGLCAETVGVAFYLHHHQTYLFQLILDSLSLAFLIWLLYRQAQHKFIFVATIVLGSLVGSLYYLQFV